MNRAVGVVTAALVAAALFVGGSIFLPSRDAGSTATRVTTTTDNLLLPGAAVAIDDRIAALKARIALGGPRVAEEQATLALAYLQKARTEADPSGYDLAERAITASFSAQPKANFEATVAQAVLAGSRHDFHGQARWAKRATKVDPFNSQAWGLLGDAQFELGRTIAGRRTYQRSIDLRPDLASFARVSNAAASAGKTRDAIVAMKRALNFAGSKENAAWANWQLGELYMGSGRFAVAERYLEYALRLVPGFASAVESTVHLAAARGDIDGAIDVMGSLVEDYPLPANFAFLGELHLLAGDDEAAATAFATADARLDEYVEHDVLPDVDFVTFWADRRIRLGEALRHARLLYRQRSSAAASDALAWALYANERYDRAARFAAEAIERGPSDAGFRFHAGMIERARGNRSAARGYLRDALELDPSWSIIESQRAREILGEA